MDPHPNGTVTFLFTDIQGSTKLWQTQPEAMKRAQARHNEILREAIEASEGYIFEVVGDAFCAAFPSAECAVQAAVSSQLDLQLEAWGEAVIRVRMGIHTGKADLRENGLYSGYTTLSRVQRLMSAAHGGQCLLSSTSEPLARESLPEGVALRDLGDHRLKDVPHAERIYELIIPGLAVDFPALRTLETSPNNLPLQLTSFIGREKELADVKRLLANTRLLTLVGPGGTGKSRLALRSAADLLHTFPHGAWLVELAPVSDASLVANAALAALNLPAELYRPAIDMLCDYLGEKEALLILDNCEHLVEACAGLADRLLHAASRLRIMITTREALGIAGEVSYRVPSLGLPDPDHLPVLESLSQYEAVRLFIERARAAQPDFNVTNENAPAVAQICHRLDGIPLAIELAAAKIGTLSPEQICKRLDDRFRLLTGGSRTAMERHQTLRAALDWSYNFLPAAERVLYGRLSTFVNGWTLEAAESVCAGESVSAEDVLNLLEGLVHKSLASADDSQSETRYRFLETVRQYAGERLTEAGESELLRDRHLAYHLELAEAAAPHVIRTEQLEWLGRLEADHDNLRAALEWSLGKERPDSALRLSAALGSFWLIHGHWKEGATWLERALHMPSGEPGSEDRALRARALYQCARLADAMDDEEKMQATAEESLVLCEQGSSQLDLAIARYHAGGVLYRRGAWAEACRFYEPALAAFREFKEPYWEASVLLWLTLARIVRDGVPITELTGRALEAARRAGERDLIGTVLQFAVPSAWTNNQLVQLQTYLEEWDKLNTELGAGTPSAAFASMRHAQIAHVRGDYRRARELYVGAIERLNLLGEKTWTCSTKFNLGMLERDDGNLDQAQALLEDVVGMRKAISSPAGFLGLGLAGLAQVLYLKGDSTAAREHFNEALVVARESEAGFLQDSILVLTVSFLADRACRSAVQILSAIQAYHGAARRTPLDRFVQRDFDDALARARLELGEAAFEAAWAEGEKLDLGEALDLALRALDEA